VFSHFYHGLLAEIIWSEFAAEYVAASYITRAAGGAMLVRIVELGEVLLHRTGEGV
jgi:hypothetical protein